MNVKTMQNFKLKSDLSPKNLSLFTDFHLVSNLYHYIPNYGYVYMQFNMEKSFYECPHAFSTA